MNPSEKICVIDDDEIYLFLIKKSLAAIGVRNEIMTFLNGVEALEELNKLKNNGQELPGIIFLDINLPIIDGWAFLLEFRTLQATESKKVPIYIVSSSTSNEDREKVKQFPEICGYLNKPLALETLSSILKNPGKE